MAFNTTSDDHLFPGKPLKEEIFELLSQRIVSGKYIPGDWLRQEDIATQLGVSMTPVREALDLLVSANLAERVPYRGVRVREISKSNIAEAYALRLFVETTAVRIAANSIDREELNRLFGYVDQLKTLISLDSLSLRYRAENEFHYLIAEVTRNDLLIRIFGTVVVNLPDWMLYEAISRKQPSLEPYFDLEYKAHLSIAQALEIGDSDLAEQRMTEYIVGTGRDLEDYLGISAELQYKHGKEIFAKFNIDKSRTSLASPSKVETDTIGDLIIDAENNPLRIFLCHSSPDKPFVRTLYRRLKLIKKINCEPWLDEKDIIPGQDWDSLIKQAVRDSHVVLVCLSKSSTTKEGYIQKEIRLAIDVALEKPENAIFIIPIRIEECDVPEKLQKWQYVDAFDDRWFDKLSRALNKRAGELGTR